ncbi:hypothetical protein [Spirochaeta isovalerica]|uniref:Sulfatase N-terminal domain-containing protein n=1 Tax=Spirochaeta isovalerica TaxID=150 RepID=A0A841RC13_9SPIO|nr:hypothetical protein [Spirochaeta isovalerica]MBB6479942.1 hypothetical protein [Spirochaeta isovalerica]
MSLNKQPNILFLFTENQPFNTNLSIRPTPMDRLIQRGSVFTQTEIPGGSCGTGSMPGGDMLHTVRSLYRLKDAGG